MSDQSIIASSRRSGEDLIVGACGLVTSLITGFILWLVEQKTGFALYTWMYWFVIPVGAGFFGFVAASGYYGGARFFGHKPSRIFLVNVVMCSLATFFLIHYLAYLTLAIDGKQVSDYIPFRQYLDISIRSTAMNFRIRGRPLGATGELGGAGYVYALLQIFGFALGGVAVYIYLTEQAYCEKCARYMAKKGRQARYTGDAEGLKNCVTRVAQHVSAGELQHAIGAQRTFGNVQPGKGNHLRTQIQIRRCKKCDQHWMKFSVAKKSGSDWSDIPDLTLEGFTDHVIRL